MDNLTKLIADVFELPPSEISMDLTPDDIEIWDSLLQLTLISGLEEEFDILLEIEEIFTIFKIGDIYELLRKRGVIE